ncbi:MAG: ATP-binding protein [Anaerolineae bacterium]
MLKTLSRTLIDVHQVTNPDDERRRRLLNILLVGLMVVAGVVILLTLIASLTGNAGSPDEVSLLYFGGGAAFMGALLIYAVNRYGNGTLAAVLLLLLLTSIVVFADTPMEVVAGRTLFLFVLPISIASVLLRPAASFIFWGLASVLITVISISINIVPNTTAIGGFFMVALVSWLTADTLERALRDLYAINRELDQRVAQRTEALQQSLTREQAEASKNQAILQDIADGVIVFDQRGKAIVANPSVTQLLNRSAQAILDKDIRSLMSGEVNPEAQEKLVSQMNGSSAPTANAQTPSVRIPWGEKTLSVSVAQVRTTPDTTIGHVMVYRDVTHEAELARMKDAFLSMASHELRTPLNAILGYADMLQEGVLGDVNTQQREKLGRVSVNATRMLDLVNNLLDQAQMEAGRLTIHKQPMSIKTLIDEVKAMTEILAKEKKLEYSTEIAADVPEQVISDPQRVHQIVMNLVGNALKFTSQGYVRLKVYRPDTGHWAVDVEDSGPGIAKEAQEYIFEAFRQVHDPTTRSSSGSGLGLSIVKQLSHLLGGDVSVKSTKGQGSTFTLTLPLTPLEEKKPS